MGRRRWGTTEQVALISSLLCHYCFPNVILPTPKSSPTVQYWVCSLIHRSTSDSRTPHRKTTESLHKFTESRNVEFGLIILFCLV